MTPLLVPESRRPRWSIERLAMVVGVVVAAAMFAAVVLITRTVGTEPLRLPSWDTQVCDDQPVLVKPDGTRSPARGCHLVKVL